jgi:hypothetical protein
MKKNKIIYIILAAIAVAILVAHFGFHKEI